MAGVGTPKLKVGEVGKDAFVHNVAHDRIRRNASKWRIENLESEDAVTGLDNRYKIARRFKLRTSGWVSCPFLFPPRFPGGHSPDRSSPMAFFDFAERSHFFVWHHILSDQT